ncbi:MAG TPA: dephospho-CoA kinase [Arthrobacter sp.]|nr:dephospho-CoA kinase [Arthrobacter sp.]
MLSIGLTGGIASGKSAIARRLAELGAVLIDADVLAREVVEPGTTGLEQIVEAFGPGVLDGEGALDRAALGGIVFDDKAAREKLNAIIHPQVRSAASRHIAAVAAGAIIVQDIPLLVETAQQSHFHLVLVVEAPEDIRVERMVSDRNMTETQARARIKAQATDEQRREAADVVIDNAGDLQRSLAAVDELWQQRLVPFEANLRSRKPAARTGPAVLSGYDPSWSGAARRIAARLHRAGGDAVLSVEHIGSTAVAGMPAKDVLDLQVTVADLSDADDFAEAFAEAGFPAAEGEWLDNPKPCDPDPEHWRKRLHRNSDPGRPVNIHVREEASPGRAFALAFRNWLRDDAGVAEEYAAEKQRLASVHAGDASTRDYAEAKEEWFAGQAYPRLVEWARKNPDRVREDDDV